MTYPKSSDVVAGQPTAADHYNYLRADVLRLGHDAADAANFGDVLGRYQSNMSLTILSTDRIRVPASTSVPVAVIIDNAPLLTTVNVDLPSGAKPSGSADMWYVFAVRTAGSTTFSIEVNTSPLESAGWRLIGSFYWNGTAIEAPSIRTTEADTISTRIGYRTPIGCQGRLFLTSTPDFTDCDGDALYLLPYKGNSISLYTEGWGWNQYPIQAPGASACSISLSLAFPRSYDVFSFWDGSKVALEYLVWTSLVSRATGLTYQDGCYVKATDPSRLYLGSFVSNDGTHIYDYDYERGLWNYFNRVPKQLKKGDATASWTYNVQNTWRRARDQANQVRVMIGLAEDSAEFDVYCMATAGASLFAYPGIGIDQYAANNATFVQSTGGATTRIPIMAVYRSVLAAGAHDIYWLEMMVGSSAVTFFGTPVADCPLGLSGWVMM